MKPGLFSCLHKKWFLIFLIFFLFINIITLFTHPIFVDPAMYWFYGHHLRWVYLDAPPLIGIITASATSLLGNSAFTINLLGLCSVLIAARFLYLLSTSLFDESAAKMITMIWLITPATLHFYFRFDWSYQNLVLLFWISSLYFFHETGKTKKPYLFYLTALSIAAGLLSQIQMFLLVAPLFFILFFLKPYKEFLKNKHFYLAFSLLILLMLPYFISFIESDFLPIRSLLSFHTTTNVSLFSLGTITNFLNDLINEINIFFILGLVLMVKNGKKIFSNNDSLFLLICSAPIFLFFLLISLKTITLIKFYYVFYFGFLLLFYPLTGKKKKRWLWAGIYINMLLFIINSWNVILPQYGISPGNNIFFNKNLKFIANALNNKIQPTDLIIGCAKDPKADMNQYLEITTLAFYNHHLNTAFLSPGYFVWQPSIETVIKKNAHNKIIYLCNTPTLPRNIGLQCSMPQSITAIQEPHHEHLISTYYVSTCHATISPINIS